MPSEHRTPVLRPTPAAELSFDSAAAQYDAARPGYPPALFDAVEELTGRPLKGCTRRSTSAPAPVSPPACCTSAAPVSSPWSPAPPWRPSPAPRAPRRPLVRARATPCLSPRAAPTSSPTPRPGTGPTPRARSRRPSGSCPPGGALALWWNVPDPDVPWIAAQDERPRRRLSGGAHGSPGRARELPGGMEHVDRRVYWTRRVDVETHLANLGSHSAFLVLGEQAAAAFLEQERAELLKVFPDGVVEEAYAVDLTVTLRAPDPSKVQESSSTV